MRHFNASNVMLLALSLVLFSATAHAGSWRPEATVGGKLKAHVYVPTTSPALADKRALMISMHGCGQTHHDFKSGANWVETADEYGMVVALPKSSNEGTYGWVGCWNFTVGMSADRTKTDAKYLIGMVDALVADASLNIDTNQVYITGLSSGASMTNQMACLAPDIFAGAGVNAGSAPGSTGNDLGNPGISPNGGRENCEEYAGSLNNHFSTQLYNNIHGTRDGSVDPSHAQRNTDIFELVYEGDGTEIDVCSTRTLPGSGDVTTLCDSAGPRISLVMVNGMEHAWPAGQGSTGNSNYIDHAHVNYPEYITDFFFSNNRRLTVVPSPTPTPTATPIPTSTPAPTVSPTPTPVPTNCVEYSALNTAHHRSGRAMKDGWGFFSTYVANGSGDNLGGTYTFTSLFSLDGDFWHLGRCQ